MRSACCLLLFAGLLAPAGLPGSRARDKDKGGEVSLDGLKSAVPGAWKQEEPASRMRFAQFRLPRAKDDKADAQVIIFRGLGGSARQNVDRWKAQFVPPEGKKIDDVAKVQEMKVGGHPATYLDVSGTYLDQPPFAAGGKAVRRPGYRMLAVQLDGPKNVYHIKLVGPARTVEEHKKEFDDWLKAFK